ARPRSWPGVKPARCRARDRAVVSPVRSAVSRNAAAPACEITVSPSAVMVSALDHPVGSFTRKVPLDMGFIWLSTPRFSQIRGTFHCPDTTLHNKIVKRLGITRNSTATHTSHYPMHGRVWTEGNPRRPPPSPGLARG